MLGISIYIWIRFEWQFGVGALGRLFHEVALTFGFFAVTQLQFDLNSVAALLTIVGYSLNDTIVVYDRIRENLKKYRMLELVPLPWPHRLNPASPTAYPSTADNHQQQK